MAGVLAGNKTQRRVCVFGWHSFISLFFSRGLAIAASRRLCGSLEGKPGGGKKNSDFPLVFQQLRHCVCERERLEGRLVHDCVSVYMCARAQRGGRRQSDKQAEDREREVEKAGLDLGSGRMEDVEAGGIRGETWDSEREESRERRGRRKREREKGIAS